MTKKPLILFTGAAVACVAALAGLTVSRWPGDEPQRVALVSPEAEKVQPKAEPKPEEALGEALEPPEKTEKPEFDMVRVEPNGEAVVAGRAKPDADVELTIDGKVIGKGKANQDGAWVVVPDAPLPKGTSEIIAEQTTGDSPEPVQSEQSIAVAIAETGESQPLIIISEPGAATKLVQKPEPEVTIALNTTGDTLVLQSPPKPDLPPDQKPAVEQAPEPVAEQAPESTVAEQAPEPKVTEEAKSAPEPVAEEKPDEPAPAEMQVEKQPEPAEQVVASAPEPEKTKPIPLSLDIVDYNDQGDIVFSGRAEPGTAVRLYVDNRLMGDAAVAGSGNWSFAGSERIAPGTHQLRADQIDGAGKVVSRIELPFQREAPEAVAALDEQEPKGQPAVEQQGEAAPAKPELVPDVAARADAQSGVSGEAAAKPRAGRVVIQPGNNLWKLSRVIYGRGVNYAVIYDANKDQIRNPDLIYPGQIFAIPDAEPPETIDPKRREPLTSAEGGTAVE